FVLLFVLLSGLLSWNKAKAECPPGWFEHQNYITYTYEKFGVQFICQAKVTFCCRWNPYTQQTEVILKSVYAADSAYRDCLWFIAQNSALYNGFLLELYKEVALFAKQDPNCSPVCPPCGEDTTFFVKLKIYNCVKWISKPTIVTNTGQILEWGWGLEYCDVNSFCLYTYGCCSDWNESPPETHTWLVSVEEIGTPECPFVEPQVPPEGKDWDEPWETECFAVPCSRR
ncbi:MAG: hypothetical protein ACPLX7_10215, partial [Candidatus Kapaibacteriota bacterium]